MTRPRRSRFDNASRRVACPRCPAAVGEVCRTAGGSAAWESHRARYQLATSLGHLPTVVPNVVPAVDDRTRLLIRRLGHR